MRKATAKTANWEVRVSSMDVKKVSIDWGVEHLTEGKPGETYYIILDKEYVFHGQSKKRRDLNEIKRLQLGILKLPVAGGTVVLQPGDLIIYHFSEEKDDFFHDWSSYLLDYMRNRGLNVILDHPLSEPHHDFLLQGAQKTYKFGTHSEGPNAFGGYFSCCGIATRVNHKHIKQITVLSEKKIPQGVSAWGISSEELEQVFLDFTMKKPA